MWDIFLEKISTWRGAVNQLIIQISAVFGAMALLSLLDQLYLIFFDTEFPLMGLLQAVSDFWQQEIRPAVSLILVPVRLLFELAFDWDIQFHPLFLDYLAVGFSLILSRWRGAIGGWKLGFKKASKNVLSKPVRVAVMAFETLVAWPWVVVKLTNNLVFTRKRFPNRDANEIAQIKFSHLLALLPVLLGIVILVLNWIYLILIEIVPFKKQA